MFFAGLIVLWKIIGVGVCVMWSIDDRVVQVYGCHLIDCHHQLIARNRHDELIVGDIRRYNTAIHYVRECGTLGPPTS